jgi:hypothetical protein
MTLHFDLDGTICTSVNAERPDCWTPEECLNAIPIGGMIPMINDLYCAGHHITIYTARREEMRFETKFWLEKHGVKYHNLDLGAKAGSDLYIDDKAINAEDFHKLYKEILNPPPAWHPRPSD